MFGVQSSLFVEISTLVIFGLTLILAAFLTKRYTKSRTINYLFWGLGLWFFAVGVILETIFAAGVYNEILIGLYLFIVALLVNLLALGSIQQVQIRNARLAYYVYTIITLFVLALSLAFTTIGNLLKQHVVAGLLPLLPTITSSFITFPAAIIIVWTAAGAYLKTKNLKLLSIIAGVVVVSAAGGLYIAAFPVFLYYSEFIGIVLLWYGFFGTGKPSSKKTKTRSKLRK